MGGAEPHGGPGDRPHRMGQAAARLQAEGAYQAEARDELIQRAEIAGNGRQEAVGDQGGRRKNITRRRPLKHAVGHHGGEPRARRLPGYLQKLGDAQGVGGPSLVVRIGGIQRLVATAYVGIGVEVADVGVENGGQEQAADQIAVQHAARDFNIGELQPYAQPGHLGPLDPRQGVMAARRPAVPGQRFRIRAVRRTPGPGAFAADAGQRTVRLIGGADWNRRVPASVRAQR